MPDELDLTEIDELLANPHWTLNASLVRYMYQMREEIRRLRALVATEQTTTDNQICTEAQAREVADMVLTWLEDGADSLYRERVNFCRWNVATEEWEPMPLNHDALITEFVEWSNQE